MVRTRFPNDCMWRYEVLGITNSHYINQIDGKLVVDHILKDFLISLPVYCLSQTSITPNTSTGLVCNISVSANENTALASTDQSQV